MKRSTISYADELDDRVEAAVDDGVFDSTSDAFRTAMRAYLDENIRDSGPAHDAVQTTAADDQTTDDQDRSASDGGVSSGRGEAEPAGQVRGADGSRTATGADEGEAVWEDDIDERVLDRREDRIVDRVEKRVVERFDDRFDRLEARLLQAVTPGDDPVGGAAVPEDPDPVRSDQGVRSHRGPETRAARDADRSAGGTTGIADSLVDGVNDDDERGDLVNRMAPGHWIGDVDSARAVDRRHEVVVASLAWLRDEADGQTARKAELLSAIADVHSNPPANPDTFWRGTLQPALEYAVEDGIVAKDGNVYQWRGV